MTLPDAKPPLFDAYLMVDWSANSKPKTGKDSIWYFLLRRTSEGEQTIGPFNPSTRRAAVDAIKNLLEEQAAKKERTLVGFDFPYGYPAGFAGALGLPGKPWQAVWRRLRDLIEDDGNNKSNRFKVAAQLNKDMGAGKGTFWACPVREKADHLSTHRPKPWSDKLKEFRVTDNWLHGPQSPWKLYAPGSVGSQALLGIPYVDQLRNDPRLKPLSRVWPFETGLRAPDFSGYSIVHGEIYPSLVPVKPKEDEIKDALQVMALARHFAKADETGKLAGLFEGPASLTAKQRQQVETEEGWILGVGAKAKT